MVGVVVVCEVCEVNLSLFLFLGWVGVVVSVLRWFLWVVECVVVVGVFDWFWMRLLKVGRGCISVLVFWVVGFV